MQGSQSRGWVVEKFGSEPREGAKYRLPFALILLVIFTISFLLQSEFILGNALPLAAGIFFLFYSIGDRIWSRNVTAAAWLKLTGNVAAFLGMAAVLVDLYLERDWIWLVFLTTALIVGLVLGWFLMGSSRDSASD